MNRDVRSDVVFKVWNGYEGCKEFHGHKIFLASCSPVFNEMLFGDGTESAVKTNAEGLTVLEIDDVRHDIFEICLDTIYGSATAHYRLLTDYSILSVCKLAEKYKIECLRIHCEKFLCRGLNNSNGLKFLILAFKYRLPELKIKARSRVLSKEGLELIANLETNYVDPKATVYINTEIAIFLLRGGDLPLERCKTIISCAFSYTKMLVYRKYRDEYSKDRQSDLEKMLEPLKNYLLKYAFMFDEKKELYLFYMSDVPEVYENDGFYFNFFDCGC